MDSNFKEKYLKYKQKYLGLKEKEYIKNMSGGDETLRLKTEICMSYITELIGAMYNSVQGVQNYIDTILSKSDYTTTERDIVENMRINYDNIKTLKAVYMEADNPLYGDLFCFKEEQKKDGKRIFIIESTRKNGKDFKSRKLSTESLTPYRNSLIALPADEGYHWIYIDNDTTIHNPYNYNMQINHSHQFCQAHSFFMALVPGSRKICVDYGASVEEEESYKIERRCAYDRLMAFLGIVLPFVTAQSIVEKKKLAGKKQKKVVDISSSLYLEIIDDITKHNLDNEAPEYHDLIKKFMAEFKAIPPGFSAADFSNHISHNVLTIMNTDYAKNAVPEWK